MMQRLTFSLLLSLVFVTSAWAIPQQYRAQQTISSSGTQIVNTVYVDNGKMRIEANIGGMKTTTLMRPDKGVAYQLMPGNIYVEIPLDGMQKMMTSFQDEALVKREPAGNETIDGKVCNKFKLTANGTVSYLWVEEGGEIPVKMETGDQKVAVRWSNVVVGQQDATLFDIPKNYQKMNIGGMMKNFSAPTAPQPAQPQ